MTDETHLEPCPFCGGKVTTGYFAEEFVVDCPTCKFEISTYDDGPDDPSLKGVAHWNTRTKPRAKALRWINLDESAAWVETSIGEYRVFEVHGGFKWHYNGVYQTPDRFPTPEEAKAAAQADYERRVLACLEGGE